MKSEPSPVADLLRPVLDTYRDAAVAVVGCHAAGISRESCEVDAVVVTNERRNPNTIRLAGTYCDLYFISEKEALRPTDPEVAASLAQSKVVRDTSLTLSTSVAANQAVFEENSKRCSRQRLAACLKALGRTDEALSRKRTSDADYWVLSASYDYAYSWLYSLEVIPAPSHLLRQLKENSKGRAVDFGAFAKGAGLEMSSRRECSSRLEGLSLLYDLLSTGRSDIDGTQPSSSDKSFQVVKGKAKEMADLKQHTDSYSFLGYEVTRLLLMVERAHHPGGLSRERSQWLVSSLSDEKQGLLSNRLIRDLGLTRSGDDVKEALELLKGRAARLARGI
jgi:hypothetical protein